MSYLYRTGLSAVVNASLAFSGKQIDTRAPPQSEADELQETEQLQRCGIEYQALMRHEVMYIQFKQRKFATFQPRRPDADDDDPASLTNIHKKKQQQQRGFAASILDDSSSAGISRSDSMTSTFSSFSEFSQTTASSVIEAQLAEQLAAAGADDIDIRIAQLQHQRERQGKRRLRYQKQNDHTWSSVKRQAPFDNLRHVERESRLDIEEIEAELIEPIAAAWFSDMLTVKMQLQIEEQKAREKIAEQEVDDSGDLVQLFHDLDDALEECELRRVCASQSAQRDREYYYSHGSINGAQQQQSRNVPAAASSASSYNFSNNATLYCPQPTTSSPSPQHPGAAAAESCSAAYVSQRRQQADAEQHILRVKSAPGLGVQAASSFSPQQQRHAAGSNSLVSESSGIPVPREPMTIPTFMKVVSKPKPPPPPPPRSDADIIREMKVRKEKYTREDLVKEEQLERAGIVAHFKEELSACRDQQQEQQQQPSRFVPGSIEERIAFAHRVDMRPPHYR